MTLGFTDNSLILNHLGTWKTRLLGAESHFCLYNKVYITLHKEEFGFPTMSYSLSATDMFCLWQFRLQLAGWKNVMGQKLSGL